MFPPYWLQVIGIQFCCALQMKSGFVRIAELMPHELGQVAVHAGLRPFEF